MFRTVLCLLGLTLAFSCGSKDDDEGGGSSWYDDYGADSGSAEGGPCAVTAETCEAFATHYLTCDGADEDYAASLADYEDAGCATTYAVWVAGGCCGGL